MRTSILQGVTPELAAVVTEMDAADVAKLAGAAERLTLLSRQSRTSRGPAALPPARARIPRSAAASDDGRIGRRRPAPHGRGRRSANGLANGGAPLPRGGRPRRAVATVVAGAIPEIMGSGQYSVAVGFIEQIPGRSRVRRPEPHSSHESQCSAATCDSAVALSSAVLDDADAWRRRRAIMPSSISRRCPCTPAIAEPASRHLDRLQEHERDEHLRLIARRDEPDDRGRAARETSSSVSRHLTDMAERQRGTHPHYYGVTMLNLAVTAILRDDPSAALDYAREADRCPRGNLVADRDSRRRS